MDLTNNERKFINSANSWQWHTNFIGYHMQHSYYLYHIIDEIMTENPEIMGIVEIGTGSGALTTVLGLWGISRNIPVLSVDIKNIHDDKVFRALKITYIQLDEFSDYLISEVKRFINRVNGPILFICDGGNKIREFNFWAPLLKPNSIIAAHDWTTEIDYDSIASIASLHCEPYKEYRWNEMNVQFVTFKTRQIRPFLSIVTRNHPGRPNLLKRCIESVEKLKDKDFQHIIIYDSEGLGIPHANQLFAKGKYRVTGEYVFMLDDDDVLISDDLVSDMKLVTSLQNYPDIIFVLMTLNGITFPSPLVWEKDQLIPGNIGTSCFVMKNELWQDSIDSFKTTELSGDFNFINTAFSKTSSKYWYGKTYARAFGLSGGKAEEDIL